MTPSLKPEIHLFHRPIIFWALQPLDFGGCTVASYANPFFSTSQTPFVPRLQYLPASDGRRGVFTRELRGSGTAPAPAPFTASYARLCGRKLEDKGEILLMEEILHQLVGRVSHYLQGFYTSQVVSRISEPSTVLYSL